MAKCCGLTLVLSFVFLGCLNSVSECRRSKWYSGQALRNLTTLGNFDDFWEKDLRPLLTPRISGTPENIKVREHIKSRLEKLNSWTIEEDKFQQRTPDGKVEFSNIIATLNPSAPKRLIVACHYDSKKIVSFEFIGATDSSVPCALMLALARNLQCLLKNRRRNLDTTLQLLFFDGEEAVRQWTEKDSLYGSKHLASKWQKEVDANGRNKLYSITEFILLDLIGHKQMMFNNFFPEDTSGLFEVLIKIEDELISKNIIHKDFNGQYKSMFSRDLRQFPYGGIQDDHLPFYRKGVKVLHLVAFPFPSVWHQPSDTEENLDKRSIANFKQIFTVFIANYLKLDSWLSSCYGSPMK